MAALISALNSELFEHFDGKTKNGKEAGRSLMRCWSAFWLSEGHDALFRLSILYWIWITARVMRALLHMGIFREYGEGYYAHKALSELFRHPMTRAMIRVMCAILELLRL